ncbi:hypothetical protein [Nocardioides sp. zg-DK7169]|nr:hypothetical protein [Nocardioides sp. zg-DK7169]
MTSPALERSDSGPHEGSGELVGLMLLWVVPVLALVLALLGAG